MKMIKLGKIAKIDISNVDKKAKKTESPVVLCNFVDVYHNWAITKNILPNLMESTANKNQINRFSICKGQVAITKDSETRDDIGVSTYIADDIPNGVLGYHCALINPDENILTGKFLNVVLHTPYAQKYFELNASGSGQRYALTIDVISGFPVPIPNLKTQHIIGDFFSAIDIKLAANNRINIELESMAKTIYDYWFTQFDFPDEHGKPYRSSGGKMIWNEKLKKEIPVGWIVIKFSDLITFEKGKTPERLFGDKTDISFLPYLTIDVVNGGQPQYCATGKMPYCNGETIMVMDGAASGDVYVGNKGILGSTFAMLKPKKQLFSNSVIYRMLKNNENIYKKANTGSTVPHANRKFIEAIEIAVPSNIPLFSKTFDTIQAKIEKCKEEVQQITLLRDWLLPMLMNGQVSIMNEQDEQPQINVSGFEQWLAYQGFAARGDVDMDVLRNIYEAMDSDDK